MILSFRRREIDKDFFTGSKAGIQPKHAAKLADQLTLRNTARKPEEINVPGWQWHALKANLSGHWAVNVNGNRRLTFTLDGEDAILVDHQDDHSDRAPMPPRHHPPIPAQSSPRMWAIEA
jgi:proteic killer suppression protein